MLADKIMNFDKYSNSNTSIVTTKKSSPLSLHNPGNDIADNIESNHLKKNKATKLDRIEQNGHIPLKYHSKSEPLPIARDKVCLKKQTNSSSCTKSSVQPNDTNTDAKISHYPINLKIFDRCPSNQRQVLHAVSCQNSYNQFVRYESNNFNLTHNSLHRAFSQPTQFVTNSEENILNESGLSSRWTYPPPVWVRSSKFAKVNGNGEGYTGLNVVGSRKINLGDDLNRMLSNDRQLESCTATKETRQEERKKSTCKRCCVRNRSLLALVVILIIITLSTLSALVYFVLFGNKVDKTGATSFVTTTTILQSTDISTVKIILNQTLYCGTIPDLYLNDLGTRSFVSPRPDFITQLFQTDARINVTSRIVGGESANILQYPWQNNQYENTEPNLSTYNPIEISSPFVGSGGNESDTTTTNAIFHQVSIQSRVVGGNDSPRKKIPWQVSLWYKKGVTCGGSIILNNWIITAAHCTYLKHEPSDWKAYFGMTSLLQKGIPPSEAREIIRITQHPKYKQDQTFDYDICLMKLKSKLIFSKHIQPICIPPSSFTFKAGMSCFVSGWGSTDPLGYTPHPDILQHAQINIIDTSTCNQMTWLNRMVTQRMICAGKPQGVRDACQGDSGGPLSCFIPERGVWMLAGSVSWGVGCGQPRYPGVYSNTTFFTDWIWNTIGKS